MTQERAPYNNLPWRITINGNPIPKGRPRLNKGHVTTPARTREYEKLVRGAAAICWQGEPLTGRVRVVMHFWRGNRIHCDLDNLVKAVTDALNCVVWNDDVQIVELRALKEYDKERPRVEIQVYQA